MDDPAVGEMCVSGLNVSKFVQPKPYSGQKWPSSEASERLLVVVSLRASPGVNFCSPFLSADVRLNIEYLATPTPSVTYEPTPSPTYPRTDMPISHPTLKPSERTWPWKDVRIIGDAAPEEVGHCLPFGRGDDASYGKYKGFVYKNLPALGTLRRGDVLAFDFATANDADIVLDLWLANTTQDGRWD